MHEDNPGNLKFRDRFRLTREQATDILMLVLLVTAISLLALALGY